MSNSVQEQGIYMQVCEIMLLDVSHFFTNAPAQAAVRKINVFCETVMLITNK